MILQQLRFRVVSLQKRFFSGFSVLDYTAQKRYNFSSAYKNPPSAENYSGWGRPAATRTRDWRCGRTIEISSPSISTSKLKAVVFDMSVLVLQNPEKDGGAGLGFTSVGGWDSWNIQQGTKGLLGYLHTRGIKAGLLPRLNIREDSMLVEKAIHALSDQMQYGILYIATNDPQAWTNSNERIDNLEHMRVYNFNSIERNDIMVFSTDENILREARMQTF